MYNIRFANNNDLEQLIKINFELGNYGWPVEQFYWHIENNTPIWVLEKESLICGFLVANFASDEVKILNLTITKTLQRQGLGQLLLQHVLFEAKSHQISFVMLEVRVDNCQALKLYNGLGFKALCIRDEYYTHLSNSDAYLMQLDLRKFPSQPVENKHFGMQVASSDNQLLAS